MDAFAHLYAVVVEALMEFGFPIVMLIAGIVWVVRRAMRRKPIM